jgi:hypothetical protein
MFLFRSLKKILQSPHPHIFNKGSVVVPGVLTFVLLIIFSPFGMENLPIIHLFILSLGIGIVVSFSVLIVYHFIKKLFPAWMHEEKWTVGKELVLIFSVIFLIAMIVLLFFLMMDIQGRSFIQLFRIVFVRTLLSSIFPVLVLVLYEQYIHHRKQMKVAEEMGEQLNRNPEKTENENPIISIKSENARTAISLLASEIVYIKAEGNYLEVYYLAEDKHLRKELIRNRLKSIYHSLPHNIFFQCHKSYVINIRHIQKLRGNARNLVLFLRYSDKGIPVSRSRIAVLREIVV